MNLSAECRVFLPPTHGKPLQAVWLQYTACKMWLLSVPSHFMCKANSQQGSYFVFMFIEEQKSYSFAAKMGFKYSLVFTLWHYQHQWPYYSRLMTQLGHDPSYSQNQTVLVGFSSFFVVKSSGGVNLIRAARIRCIDLKRSIVLSVCWAVPVLPLCWLYIAWTSTAPVIQHGRISRALQQWFAISLSWEKHRPLTVTVI